MKRRSLCWLLAVASVSVASVWHWGCAKKVRTDRDYPLAHAIADNDAERVALLLRQGADVNALERDVSKSQPLVRSPLSLAVSARRVEIVKLLLAHDDIRPDFGGFTGGWYYDEMGKHPRWAPPPLWSAYPDRELLGLLLAHEKTDPNREWQQGDGSALLRQAMGDGNTQVAEMLLGHARTDVNLRTTTMVTSYTMRRFEVPDTIFLMEAIELVNSKRGLSLWARARRAVGLRDGLTERRREILRMLAKHPRVEINAFDASNGTSLRLATSLNDAETVALLLSRDDIDINAVGSHSQQDTRHPLEVAVNEGSEKIVGMLLNHGTLDLHRERSAAVRRQLDELLSVAAAKGYVEVVAALLENGVAPSAEAAKLARAGGHGGIADLLERQGSAQ